MKNKDELFENMKRSAEYSMQKYNVHFHTSIEIVEELEKEFGHKNTTWFYEKCKEKGSNLKFVEKGYIVKGIVIGQKIKGCMVVAVDDDDSYFGDVAIAREYPTNGVTIARAYIDGERYALKEYLDYNGIEWLNSLDVSFVSRLACTRDCENIELD